MQGIDFQNIRFVQDNIEQGRGREFQYEEYQTFVKRTKRFLFSHAVTVSAELFPEMFSCIEEVRERIAPHFSIESFIRPDPVPQAYCINLSSQQRLAIVFTSALVDLLSRGEMQFVIGHELGHHLLEHYKYTKPEDADSELSFLRQLFLSRCAEISADRIGFIASSSVDDALRGMLKIASGLSEKHIKLNIPIFMDQIRELKSLRGSTEGAYSTHPVIPLRMRALLWFSMSDSYYEAVGRQGQAPLSKEVMEQKIVNDLHEISDSIFLEQERRAVENIVLWASLRIAAFKCTLTKKDQMVIKEFVDRMLVDKAVTFLKGRNTEYSEIIDGRLTEAIHNGRGVRGVQLGYIKEILNTLSNRLLKKPSDSGVFIDRIIQSLLDG